MNKINSYFPQIPNESKLRIFDIKKNISFHNSLIRNNVNSRSKTMTVSSNKNSVFNKSKLKSNKLILNVNNDNGIEENKSNFDNYYTIDNFNIKDNKEERVIKSDRTYKKRKIFKIDGVKKTQKFMKINVFTLGKSYSSIPLKNLIIDMN